MALLQPGKHRRIVEHERAAELDPAVPLLHRLRLIVPDSGEVVGLGRGNTQLHILVQGALVALERQHIVATLVEDLLGDLPLAAHGINRHQAPSEGQLPQEFGQGGDLIGFVLDLDLSQHQAIGRGPGTHQVDGRLAAAPIVRAAKGLAVEGDDLGGQDLCHRFHPALEAAPKLDGIEGGKDPVEGVMGGNAMRQVQEGGEPLRFGFSEQLDAIPALGAANDGADGDDDDTEQRVKLGSLDPRVRKLGKMVGKREGVG